jgi:hypothetical protein
MSSANLKQVSKTFDLIRLCSTAESQVLTVEKYLVEHNFLGDRRAHTISYNLLSMQLGR